MQLSDGKVGTRELMAMLTFTIGLKAADVTPDLLIEHAKNAAWLLSLITAAVMVIPLFLSIKLMKKYKAGFAELIPSLTGIWGNSIIIGLFFITLFISTFLNGRSYIDIVQTMFFPETNIPILFFLLMLFSSMVAKRGFETICRVSWLYFWIVMIVGASLLLLTWQQTNYSRLFPLAGSGTGQLLWNGVTHSSVYGEVILIAFLYQYTKTYTSFRNGVWISFGVSTLLLIIFNAVFVMVFDYPAVKYLAFPYQQLTRAAAFGKMSTHLESVFLGVWIMSAVVHFAIYLYLLAFLFGRLFRIEEFEPLILPFAGLIFILGSVPYNIMKLENYHHLLITSSSTLFILVPLLLWLFHLWKERAT